MKIGIMTFWWTNDNYGQILQCYALQKYLRDKGHEAYLIRYDPKKDYTATPFIGKLVKACNPISLYGYIRERRNAKKSALEEKRQPRMFSAFKDTYIVQSEKIYYSWKELKDCPPQADMYIVGSDQVWNFYQAPLQKCRNILHAYFLDFGDASVKRVAYAASWGKTSVSDAFITEITPLLARFDAVSVRELSGLDLCRRCNRAAQLAADPVFLLKASQYRTLCSQTSGVLPQKEYLFVYFLGNQKYVPTRNCFAWAEERQLDVVYVTANARHDSYPKAYPSITEWLSLICNARYVITNSFHCSVFSLLFGRQFGIFKLDGAHAGMNGRFETLFSQTGITERYITETDFSMLDVPYSAQMPDSSFIEDVICG